MEQVADPARRYDSPNAAWPSSLTRSGRIHGNLRHSGKHRSRNCPVAAGTCTAGRRCRAGSEEVSRQTQEGNRCYTRRREASEKAEETPLSRGAETDRRGCQKALGHTEGSRSEIAGRPMIRAWAGVGPVSSVCCFDLVFRPKRRLNGTGSLMSEVGEYPGPVNDATLSPCLSRLCLPELAFCVAHSPAPSSVELWIVMHAGSRT